ncbi:MAG: chitobiase/beta-hexosaminidase C-terminal domain-containing protein, partial [Desulfobacteraceae bacterium]|nr:chitobiase/beta-hexosaminidase C-terminal domain-containing protein [Desulfobacteraceae bacterium]
QLVIHNSTDPDGDTLTYVFELYADEEMNTLVADAPNVSEGTNTTSWGVSMELSDNTWYFWRARATDGALFSQWVYGSFFVHTENDSPGNFNISSPWDNAEVDTLTPVLQVTNSVDIDEDRITYDFEVYADTGMSTLVASASGIPEGAEGSTSWVVDIPLNDETWHYWKVITTDEHGATTESPPAAFLVNTLNTAPEAPGISSPAVGSEVTFKELDLAVTNATDPDGDALTYFFELDKVNSFDSEAKQTSGEILEGEGTTTWHVAVLEDNSLYYWRVKASDGTAESTWAVGSFFVNTANDTPFTPTRRNPGQGSWVDTPTPMLQLNPSGDSDNDSLTYRFEVYTDDSLTSLFVQGESDAPWWAVPTALSDSTWNYWRAQSVDEHDSASSWTAAAAFFVKDDGVDDPPEITILEPAAHLLTNHDTVLIRWEDNDPDSNATISLYYDSDDSGEDGTLIVEGLDEDSDGTADTYTWDISGLEGTYYIYATITDGNSSITSYGQAAITIDRTPPTVEAAPPGGTYTTTQTVSLSADEAAEIYYTTDGTELTSESFLYTDPIEISETTTLKFMAVDGAVNQSETITEVYTIVEEPENLSVTVVTDKGRELSGIKVYAFTESGSYTGKNSTTDESGTALFALEDFDDGTYKFRVDYLGSQFWSQVITIPGTAAIEIMIEEETVTVAVTTGSGPVEGVRVYLFSESGSYLGIYEVTDAEGMIYFDLPAGKGFKFRADILGGQYWSDVTTVAGGGMNSASVEAGGGLFQVTVEKAPDSPMEGIKVYLFSQSGIYLGRYAVTNASGVVEFSVPERTYKVRADYLGYQFWSAETQIIGDTGMALTIIHQQVEVTVQGVFHDVPEPIEGIKVYLFSSAGSYLGQYQHTDSSGKVTFNLPEKAYKVRADYVGQQFWFEEFTWENVTIEVPMADVEITVTGAGLPKEGVKIYVFSSSVSYLGLFDTTDNDGKVTFRIPEGAYRFRVDYQGSQFWSPDSLLAKDQVNYINISTGGGAFTVTVLKGASEPLVGVNGYVFNEEGSYLGMFGATNSDGQATFDLSDGAYKFRVDYLGYQFWSDVVTIPNVSSVEVLIDQEEVEVAVAMGSGPAEGVKVYLFSEADTYLGIYDITDLDGRVIFALPVGKAFKFRVDILNNQYWSDVHTVIAGQANHVSINAGGGLFQVTLEKGSGNPMAGIKVYLFNDSDTYLGLYQTTDAAGLVTFNVPQGTYKTRADYLGYQFWSTETQVTGDTNIVVTIPHQPAEVTVQGVFQEEAEPIEGIKIYLFSSAGSYLGQYQQTNSSGKATFDLPEKAYKVRADYLGQQFWSDDFQSQDTTITIYQGLADIHIHRSGVDVEGAKVYLFSEAGSYLGWYETTDSSGRAEFLLPDRPYKFRIDEGGSQYWTSVTNIVAGHVNLVEVNLDGLVKS